MNASEKAQVASIEIAEMIAQQTKLHTLTESIILLACRKMAKTMLGDEAEQEISKIPLSNNTIRRRIMDLFADIEDKLQNSKFALQVDLSTDISNKAQLHLFALLMITKSQQSTITFIRFIDGNQIIN
ncbi:protein FAM200A-like [Octopus bimaculoides]|uniref:protein FAM200A-like n=1 Tax=Octopus bimaculoides TaxID=37653 RepID=UPI00071C6A17|nr:protein FAM200A-like [Octopus bimaculoides]|eukprot:XP_014779403.1 PREDICTED: protein FAM200A-like [Octopus bimaculoides]